MNAAVIDDRNSPYATAWWFLDTLVVEHRRAAGMSSVVLEMTLPVGHAQALHVHDDLDDTWYVIEGRMAVRCGDDEHVAEAGHWISMPRGVPHSFRVVGKVDSQTPIFSDEVEQVIFHPFWGVPDSIKRLELQPNLAAGGGILARQGLRVQLQLLPVRVDVRPRR